MNCPACNESLVMTERSGVEIDYCSKCRGVWLDRGELDKIIEKNSQTQTSQPFNRESDRYDNDRDSDRDSRFDNNKRPRKREGFLGELFDF